MKIGILKKGDKVLTITAEFIAVQRKNGEVDIIPMVKDEMGLRVDIEEIVTIWRKHRRGINRRCCGYYILRGE